MLKFDSEKTNIFFTSDSHYGHKNIVLGESDWADKSGCRPYDSVDFMNYILVENINATVREDDILFHLGDWSFGGIENIRKFRSRLLVNTIYLIAGNHDKHIKTKSELSELFNIVSSYEEIVIGKQLIVLSHYPMCSWNEASKGSWMLHGHCHGTLFKDGGPNHWYHKSKILDVGIDNSHNFSPLPYKTIRNIMNKKQVFVIDHHDEKTSR